MKFTEFVQNKMSEQPIDVKDVSYTACVLHKIAQQELLAQAEHILMEAEGISLRRPGWLIKAHHMTVLPPQPSQGDITAAMPYFGKEVQLTVTNWAADQFGFAVVVRPDMALPIKMAVPHITIAHSKDVGAKYSNSLLMSKLKWNPVKEFTLQSFYAAIGRNGNTFPNMDGLARA